VSLAPNQSLIFTSAYLTNKDTFIISDGTFIQPVEEFTDGQEKEKTDVENLYDGPEIVKQSELDHFNAILLKAQKHTVEAQREKS